MMTNQLGLVLDLDWACGEEGIKVVQLLVPELVIALVDEAILIRLPGRGGS